MYRKRVYGNLTSGSCQMRGAVLCAVSGTNKGHRILLFS